MKAVFHEGFYYFHRCQQENTDTTHTVEDFKHPVKDYGLLEGKAM